MRKFIEVRIEFYEMAKMESNPAIIQSELRKRGIDPDKHIESRTCQRRAEYIYRQEVDITNPGEAG